ncbi:hypothetical protein [Flavobacterium eburneipallidum]|uniref:hypothetical protein n=1 Tax=Flavobacterium eburneipallidum TaxID=3003263 RepID=UPI0022AC39AF|nr:hypothetical protein [Flavobacterium eburneipallidum]
MKKLIVLALLLVGTSIIAQPKNKKHHPKNEMEQFTPEQRSELMVKKMTLELDLNASQQKEISTLLSEKSAKREAHKAEMKARKEKGTKPTSDEKFAMKSKMLDEQIATKKRMQKILNEKQFEKWTALKEDHQRNPKDFRGERKGKHPQNQERRG